MPKPKLVFNKAVGNMLISFIKSKGGKDVSVGLIRNMFYQAAMPVSARYVRALVEYITDNYYDFDEVIDSTENGYSFVDTVDEEAEAYKQDIRIAKTYIHKAYMRRKAFQHKINKKL